MKKRLKSKSILTTVLLIGIILSTSETIISSTNKSEVYSEIQRIMNVIDSTEHKILTISQSIGERNVRFWEHEIDGIILKGDYMLLHLDVETKEPILFQKEWSDITYFDPPAPRNSFEPDNYFWKQKICFQEKKDCSNFYTFTNSQAFPVICWEVRHTDGKTLLYNMNGNLIGQGIPGPMKGFSLSGWVMQSDPDNYIEFRQNADVWYNRWCKTTTSISLPTTSMISSYINDADMEYFYVMAHGNHNFFQADSEGSYYYASDLNNAMSNRERIRFAFIGTCQSMTQTGPGTFSYEFRKGHITNTVTIGFDHMENCPGWQYEYYWQNSIFENMSKGLTIKESFDLATARYPTIEPAVVFIGDENLYIPQPKVECQGTINRVDLPPDQSITESFTIQNTGDPNSLLYWEIESFPEWGTWEFSPLKGNKLSPEDGPVTVEVSLDALQENEKEFTGEIKIINSYEPEDYEIIPVSIETPKYKTGIQGFLLRVFEDYPFLSQIIQLILKD